MKKAILLAMLSVSGLFVSGCSATGQSRLSACPLSGLESITFFAGAPEQSASLAPSEEKTGSGILTWNFGDDAGNIYIACNYDAEEETVQKLPSNFRSCTATYDLSRRSAQGLPVITDLTCEAEI